MKNVLFCVILTFFGLQRGTAQLLPSDLPNLLQTPTNNTIPSTRQENSYVGVWTVNSDPSYDIVIFPNGQAISTHTKAVSGGNGQRGFWREHDQELIIFWDNEATLRITRKNDAFVCWSYISSNSVSDSEVPVTKVEGPLAGFVGIWRLNKEPDGNYLYLLLQSSGRVLSTIGGGTEGRWEMTKEGALCSWPDGWMDLIFTTAEGYQKRSWVGPLEQNTTPSDISEAVRVGEKKFSITP